MPMKRGQSVVKSRSRVLIVDDELFFREAIGDTLVTAGFQIGLAEDGQSALSSADDESYGVMVLDVTPDAIALSAEIPGQPWQTAGTDGIFTAANQVYFVNLSPKGLVEQTFQIDRLAQ